MRGILVGIIGVTLLGCATPPKQSELDNRTNAILRMCGGGASYFNSASFTAKLDQLIKQGVGSAALQTNSDLKSSLMGHDAVNSTNIENIYKQFTQCVTTNNLVPSGEGCAAVISMGDGNTTGDVTSSCN